MAAFYGHKIAELRFCQMSLGMPQSYLPTTFGFGWGHRGAAATMNRPGSSERYVVCPSWALLILAGLLGTYPGIVFIRRPFRRARRLRNGWCLACGYDLQGNVSGVCPECGSPSKTPRGIA